ncbi:hypothetical protein HNP77_001827 [Treponema rectale]|uniref:Calcineurin-like phosphoesterase domain-containing protein n=1 Tax=Treponema rectale TaxID=744512 RepID=A0A840SFD3_9SPIR|nr:metallophosphoesterase [Treponema rectale]MBB5219445.1 hypothetical protein [Treponema rectale]
MNKKTLFALAEILLCLSFFSSCRSIRTQNYEIIQKKNTKSETLRILQISDFHSNDFGKNEAKLIEKVKAAQPDLIVLTGDIFDFDRPGIKPVQNVKYLLEGITPLCPVYYVSGNHEYYNYHNDEYNYMIEEYGGKLLKNKAEKITIKNVEIIIAGLDDPFADLDIEHREKKFESKEKYRARISDVCTQAAELMNDNVFCTILLAHRPEYIREYLSGSFSFDLILSGHAHGGQWRFPGINGLYAPMQGLFPKFAGGRYDFNSENQLMKKNHSEKESQVFIVSRGLSYQSPGVPRIMNNPELVVINISAAELPPSSLQ